ncbi:Nadh Dehydrogenase [Ubiquinone] 1 Alpha Subcomplex Subunit 2 [Manis pentadactyla]|nr:Nadh Dehydrogenase [Ubiquinone] 1 Alpha Subcomplex Subunit 2 [Manis pentadactyla]
MKWLSSGLGVKLGLDNAALHYRNKNDGSAECRGEISVNDYVSHKEMTVPTVLVGKDQKTPRPACWSRRRCVGSRNWKSRVLGRKRFTWEASLEDSTQSLPMLFQKAYEVGKEKGI